MHPALSHSCPNPISVVYNAHCDLDRSFHNAPFGNNHPNASECQHYNKQAFSKWQQWPGSGSQQWCCCSRCCLTRNPNKCIIPAKQRETEKVQTNLSVQQGKENLVTTGMKDAAGVTTEKENLDVTAVPCLLCFFFFFALWLLLTLGIPL